MTTDDIDSRIHHALSDLRRIIDQYEVELARTEPPFGAHAIPERIKLRLKLLQDLNMERGDVLRAMSRRNQP